MMTKLQINLSSRPFANYTLYHLGYVVLGLVGLLLMVHNSVWFFTNHGDVRTMEQEIAAKQTEVDSNIRETRALAEEIDQIQRNRRFREVVSFVDGRIRQRRFSWIRMLNLLQDAIPADVKIESITPRVQQNSIRIMLVCLARREGAVNQFIENLEGVGDFSRVLITSEDREGGTTTFPLTMDYSPAELTGGPPGADRASAGAEDQAAPGPDPLAEAISLAELPDPVLAGLEFPEVETRTDGGLSDPFAIEGEDPFAAAGDLFGEAGAPEAGSTFVPPAEPVEESAPDQGAANPGGRTRASGELIKKPPRKPGEGRSRSRPPGRHPGGRS